MCALNERMPFQFNFTIEDHLEDELIPLEDGALALDFSKESSVSERQKGKHSDKKSSTEQFDLLQDLLWEHQSGGNAAPSQDTDHSLNGTNSLSNLEPYEKKALLESCQRTCSA